MAKKDMAAMENKVSMAVTAAMATMAITEKMLNSDDKK